MKPARRTHRTLTRSTYCVFTCACTAYVHTEHQHICNQTKRLVLCSEETCGVRTINLNGDNEKRARSLSLYLSHGTY